MNNKLILIGFFILVLCSFGFASDTFLGIFKTGEPINLVQTCANCTFVNITSIINPASTLIINDVAMTKNDFTYNYTLSQQALTGTYQACGVGDLDGTNTIWCYSFDITESGKPNPENRIIALIIAFIATIIYFTFFGFKAFQADLGKASFWFSLLCFGIGLVELVFMIGVLFINEYNVLMIGLLKINFYMIAIIAFGLGLAILSMIYMKWLSFNKEDDKWQVKKW